MACETDAARRPVHLVQIDWILASEEVDLHNLDVVVQEITREQAWTHPICVEGDSLVVMDGNHRLAAAKVLDLAYIPVVKYSYDHVVVESRRDDYHVTAFDIIDRALTKTLYPEKTTRHIFPDTVTSDIKLAELRSGLANSHENQAVA